MTSGATPKRGGQQQRESPLLGAATVCNGSEVAVRTLSIRSSLSYYT
jgi:hypothetical protein